MQPPLLNNANKAILLGKALEFPKTRSLAFLILLLNGILYTLLFYFGCLQPPAFLSLLLFLFLILVYKKERKKSWSSKNKQLIKRKLSTNFTHAKYHPQKGISKQCYLSSKILNNVAFDFSSTHLVELKENKMQISNIIASHISSNDFETPFFEGVLLSKEYSNNINGYILFRPIINLNKPDVLEIFKKLYDRYLPADAERVSTENKEFDKQFETYTNCLKNWKDKLSDDFFADIITMNNSIMKQMKKEKESADYFLFTKHSILKKSPVVISITSNQIFIGVRNMNLFRIFPKSSPERTNNTIEKSNHAIQTMSCLFNSLS